jgi:hypothetical protein
VMQADEASMMKYDSLGKFEQGKSISRLTRSDSLSWKEKSWVIGLQIGSETKAYDWAILKSQRIINDIIGKTPVVIVLSTDGQSFAAFERADEKELFSIRNDTLYAGSEAYDFAGNGITIKDHRLKRVMTYQEFWHSWQTFHPRTEVFK